MVEVVLVRHGYVNWFFMFSDGLVSTGTPLSVEVAIFINHDLHHSFDLLDLDYLLVKEGSIVPVHVQLSRDVAC